MVPFLVQLWTHCGVHIQIVVGRARWDGRWRTAYGVFEAFGFVDGHS